MTKGGACYGKHDRGCQPQQIFSYSQKRPGLLGGLRSVVNPQVRVVEAVQALSLRIERGEMIGLIGPNGAGKSTTIKMLTGILMPSGGSVRVAGLDPQRQRRELAGRIGVVFGQRSQLWWGYCPSSIGCACGRATSIACRRSAKPTLSACARCST